jgi:hypothetical protein
MPCADEDAESSDLAIASITVAVGTDFVLDAGVLVLKETS